MCRAHLRCALLLALLVLAAPMALAQTAQEQVATQLQAQGWSVTRVGRTLLFRVRIEAVRGGQLREVILNPRTGEILRDYTRPLRASDRQGPIRDDGERASGGASSDERDDDEDDDDDDDGDDGDDD